MKTEERRVVVERGVYGESVEGGALPLAAQAWGVATKSWWLFALRGVIALIAAYVFFAAPGRALATLALFLAAWVLVDGVFSLAASIPHRSWFMGITGVISIVVGWLMLSRPVGAVIALFVLAAAWALARGIGEIVLAMQLAKGTQGRGWLATAGLVSCLFGVLLIAAPYFGAIALAVWIGAYALFHGIAEISAAAMLFKAKRRGEERRIPPVGGVWHRQRTV